MELFSKSKDIFFSNFNKICRTCIKTVTEPLHQIFDSEVVILNESIRTCELLIAVSTLKMHPNDDLPKAICLQCLDSLTKAYNFQKMCILSDLCMRSAILPKEMQISLQDAPLTNPVYSGKQSDNSTNFKQRIPNLITPSENLNNINIVFSESVNTDIENIGISDESIVSKPIMQSEILPSEDINGIKILLLPAESSDLIHSGSSMIIPSEINSRMNIFSPVPPSVDHLGSSMIIPNEINGNINIFSAEGPAIDQLDPSNKEILLGPHTQSNMLLNQPRVDLTNVSLTEVPPWKKGATFQSIKKTPKGSCAQRVTVPSKNNRSINVFSTKVALTSSKDHLNMANVPEPCIPSANILIEEKNFKKNPKKTLPTVNNPAQHSNETYSPNDQLTSIIQSVSERSSHIVPFNPLYLKAEVGHCEETIISKTEPTSERKDEKLILAKHLSAVSQSAEYNIKNARETNLIQNMDSLDETDEKSNIYLLAACHSTEKGIEHYDVPNVKTNIPTSFEVDDNNDDLGDSDSDDKKTEVVIDAEDFIQKNIVDNKFTRKEEPLAESEESNGESLGQNSIEEDVETDMKDPKKIIQENENPNQRTKKHACFTCATCGKTFDRKHRLHRHMNLHKKEGRPFECEYCRRRFVQEAHLERHFITHEKTFLDMLETQQNVDGNQCLACPKKNLKQESLASEIRTHKGEIDAFKRFNCDICSEVFESLYRLTRHKHLHEGNRKYKCDTCGQTFGLSSHLVEHLNMHSGIKPHVCDYCQKSFQQACTLKDHLRTHTGEQPFLCAECGKTFNNSSNLRQHQLRHSGVKRYQCSECPSRFTCKSGLCSHKTTHRNQKPYVCETCGSRFTKNYSLKKHERIHTGERPYKCDYCEMRFNSSDHMKRHMRTHTGEKPYACKYCERKFAQSNDVIKHLRSHVGENVYKCEECGANFRLNTELKKHISEHYQAKVNVI